MSSFLSGQRVIPEIWREKFYCGSVDFSTEALSVSCFICKKSKVDYGWSRRKRQEPSMVSSFLMANDNVLK